MAGLDLRRALVKLVAITLPAIAVVALVLAVGVEAWVRVTHDPRKGTPGLFLADPARRMRLAPGYSGWFAGVPVHTNGLGLRDDREYTLEKGASTFRILVLGDSVTFGHGGIAENAYPRLLEKLLREWRSDVDWQVWNAGVPGYNTSQELAHLLELGPLARPDLVVVGFFLNDLVDNYEVAPPGRKPGALSGLRAFTQRHVLSLDLYRKVWLTLQWKLTASDAYLRRLDALNAEDALLSRPDDLADRDRQQLTAYERLSDEQVATHDCNGERPEPGVIEAIQREPGWPAWLKAVRDFQALNAAGTYRVVFFLNIVPPACPSGDIFYDGGVGIENAFFLRVLGEGTPAVSVFEAFLHRRPSQMPNARSHAFGNANLTKAETLFAFLKAQRLVPAP